MGNGSYRQILLNQTEPLERHEISVMKEWLETLRGDVEMFGETAEDTHLMRRIESRLEQEK